MDPISLLAPALLSGLSSFLQKQFTDLFSGSDEYNQLARGFSSNIPGFTSQTLVNAAGYAGPAAAVSAQNALASLSNTPSAISASNALRRIASSALESPSLATRMQTEAAQRMVGAMGRNIRSSLINSPGARASITGELTRMLQDAFDQIGRTSISSISNANEIASRNLSLGEQILQSDRSNQFSQRVAPYLAQPQNYQGLLSQENFRAPFDPTAPIQSTLGAATSMLFDRAGLEYFKSLLRPQQ
ncbi:MAG: hypothetical protein KatS3mg083_100 [Candidatus Dojkabacteria bacterium]|nr:MAG: hypothetical protein KatS3mg083_100 [Candidatus Dojkabacteria bacterium]